MQTPSVNWLEVIQALGPYVTAIVALVVAALTAWLAHRHWLQQFLTEKSFTLREEKIRLLQEIPTKLMRAALLSQNALIWRAMYVATETVAQEREHVPDEAIHTILALKEKHTEATAQIQQLSLDLYTLRITSRVYFGEETGLAVETALGLLPRLLAPEPEYTQLTEGFRQNLRHALDRKLDLGQLISTSQVEQLEILKPLMDSMGESVAKVVRCMVEHLQQSP